MSTASTQNQSESKLPFAKQHQKAPGLESKLDPRSNFHASRYQAAGKLEGKVALITGDDSGIGRAVTVLPSDAGLPPEKVTEFGRSNPMGRPAQPEELAPAHVFLAPGADSSFITGTVLQVMGGETTGG